MTITTRALVVLTLTAAAVAGVRAQQPAAQKPPAPAGSPAAAPPAAAPPAVEAASTQGYSYKSDGRRDPFVSLLGRASDQRGATNRPTGLAGVLINEVVVTGIVRSGAGFIATLKAPDNKTYIVRSGERLMDGTVKSISDRQVVFSQDVNDPLSLIKQREIPKTVRPGGESME